MPTEFERDTHYFMSTDLATDIEPEEETDPKEYNCRFQTDNQVHNPSPNRVTQPQPAQP